MPKAEAGASERAGRMPMLGAEFIALRGAEALAVNRCGARRDIQKNMQIF